MIIINDLYENLIYCRRFIMGCWDVLIIIGFILKNTAAIIFEGSVSQYEVP